MGTNKVILPEWSDCDDAVQKGNPTILERFIYNNEPVDHADEWRMDLKELLWYAKYGSIVVIEHD